MRLPAGDRHYLFLPLWAHELHPKGYRNIVIPASSRNRERVPVRALQIPIPGLRAPAGKRPTCPWTSAAYTRAHSTAPANLRAPG